jgi:hypothetical protein
MIPGAARRRARIETATTYARLLSGVGHLAQIGLAAQLARMEALPGAVAR